MFGCWAVGWWQSKDDKVSSSGPRYFQQTLMQKSGPHEFVEKFVTERNDELHATEVRTQHSRTPWRSCGCP